MRYDLSGDLRPMDYVMNQISQKINFYTHFRYMGRKRYTLVASFEEDEEMEFFLDKQHVFVSMPIKQILTYPLNHLVLRRPVNGAPWIFYYTPDEEEPRE